MLKLVHKNFRRNLISTVSRNLPLDIYYKDIYTKERIKALQWRNPAGTTLTKQ